MILNIDVVIVIYNPNEEQVKSLIFSLLNQVRRIYIIDNSLNPFFEFRNDKVIIIRLNNNYGIAYAQNLGISLSLKNNSDFILLSDQDTLYPFNYINKLIDVFYMYDNVAAVAPVFIDSKSNSIFPAIYKTRFAFRRFFPISGVYSVSHAIASGLLLNSKFLPDIGFMDQDLFIDWVDIEWCWRANKKGYKILVNSDIHITHNLGDKYYNILNRDITIRNHIRHYYITRNAFYLSIYSDYLDLIHKFFLFFNSFKYLIGYPIFSKPHFLNLKFVILGFYHALIKKMGPYQNFN